MLEAAPGPNRMLLWNSPGSIRVQRQRGLPWCRSKVCVYSYVLKLDAKDIFCTKAAARLTSDSHRTDSFSFSLRPNPDPWAFLE